MVAAVISPAVAAENARAAQVARIARAHLDGIEGGLAGAVQALRCGVNQWTAADIRHLTWGLPEGIGPLEVEREVLAQLREAAEADAYRRAAV
jgi:hypothetical protein